MTPDNDIEFKNYLAINAGYTIDDMGCYIKNGLMSTDIDIDMNLLIKTVEIINTSSGNIDGKRLYIVMNRSNFTIYQINDDGSRDDMKTFQWSYCEGMFESLKQAIYYVYQKQII